MTVPTLDKLKLGWVPFVLLLVALSTVFLFGNDRGHYYRPGHHDAVSSNYMTVVANLSSEHNFVRFHHQTLDADGKIAYDVYHRFPIGGYILLKLAILPFGDDFSAQIYAARMAMLLFFIATAVLAYLSLCRLTANRWIALAATLLAFSSSFCLYYNDMVATELGIDFFGVMLTFHGLVIFRQEGRFRQLLVRICIALLLGWHVFALLLPFIVFNLVRELNHARNNGERLVVALLRSRSLTLGIVALLFGLSVLSFNFAQEYIALKGEKSLTSLSSFLSMSRRTGMDQGFKDQYAPHFAWVPYMERQFSFIGSMLLPYSLFGSGQTSDANMPWMLEKLPGFSIVGIGVCGACLIGLIFVRHKLLLATLAVSGFCWTLPMCYFVIFHTYESLSYIGIPLVGFTLALLGIHKLLGKHLVVGLAVVALPIFVLSSFQMGKVGYTAQEAEFHTRMMADFDVIRNITKGKVVQVLQAQLDQTFSGAYQSTAHYLVGSIILYKGFISYNEKANIKKDKRDRVDFVITRDRDWGTALLTPENQLAFLYDRAAYDTQQAYPSIVADEPIIRSHFDIYLNADTLSYVKEPCAVTDTEASFFIHTYPDHRKLHGYDSETFQFGEKGVRFDEKCIARVALPEYDIDYIRTGQYASSAGSPWETKFPIKVAEYKQAYRSIVAGEPIISHFDVYLNADTLSYVKEPCAVADTEARFFIDTYPFATHDLPDHRKQHSYDSETFQFEEKGVRFDEKCIARVALPEYDIDYIRTGQYASAGPLWETEFPIKVAEYKQAYRSIVVDEPIIRSHFDIYLNGDTLSYVKEPCTVADTETLFLLDLIPADEKASPDHRKQLGYDNMVFEFMEKGGRFDEKCIARVVLPEYDIDYIRTSQYTNTDRVWENIFSVELAEYKQAYRSIVAGEPVIHSLFSVYLNGNTLSYVKEPCAVGDTEARFFIDIYPLDTHELPDHRKQYGYDSAFFEFKKKGERFDEKCMARVVLPEYDIKFIKTGQWVQDRSTYWEAIYDFDLNDLYDLIAASNEPIIRSDFDVYLRNNILMYLKEPCEPDDTEMPFFLHFTPTDVNDLPDHRKPSGSDNRDWDWQAHGTHFDGRCMAQVMIPQYDFRHLRTGQYIWRQGAIHNVWQKNIFFGEAADGEARF